MSIASRIFLTAALAAGLLIPAGAQAAVQEFMISLTDMTFERGSGLSAEAAACCDPHDSAIELPNNTHYNETLTGDYAAVDDLSDQQAFWQTFIQISLNGTPFFTANQIVLESQGQVFATILRLTGLKRPLLNIIIATLENHNHIDTGGIFDYAYNPPPSPMADRSHGTFAVGSTKLGSPDDPFGSPDDPLSVFESIPVSDRPNVWSLTFSAAFFAPAPEPPTWVMLMAGGTGLLAIRGLTRRRGMAPRVSA
jgi:hypothetical protein